jgi:hypothetical protein
MIELELGAMLCFQQSSGKKSSTCDSLRQDGETPLQVKTTGTSIHKSDKLWKNHGKPRHLQVICLA